LLGLNQEEIHVGTVVYCLFVILFVILRDAGDAWRPKNLSHASPNFQRGP